MYFYSILCCHRYGEVKEIDQSADKGEQVETGVRGNELNCGEGNGQCVSLSNDLLTWLEICPTASLGMHLAAPHSLNCTCTFLIPLASNPFSGPSAVEPSVSDCTIVWYIGVTVWLFGACLLWPALVPANVLEVLFHNAILFWQLKISRDYNYQRREALWNVELCGLKDCQAVLVL